MGYLSFLVDLSLHLTERLLVKITEDMTYPKLVLDQ